MMESLNKLTPVLTNISQTTQIEDVILWATFIKLNFFKIYKNMTNFDEAMDGILVQNKILEESMNKSMGDNQQELAVIKYLLFI